MRYVILRDDDTNALTPVRCLERLYRPFLDHGMAVNLSVIPRVRLDATSPDGSPEQFLFARGTPSGSSVPIGDNEELSSYLHGNPGFHIVQHGFDHSAFEFDSGDADDVRARLELGTDLLMDAGFPRPQTFVAPHDTFSRVSLAEAAKRFRVISTGWFELARLPLPWWPRYALKKIAGDQHWQIGRTVLLSHPGCLLSYHRPYQTMLREVRRAVENQALTVLVTHWWEYFCDGVPNEGFIQTLHELASWFAGQAGLKVISFDALPDGDVPLS